MAGVKPLRKIQLGQEVTAGTAVAATGLWRGMGTIQDGTEPEVVEEDIGLLVPSDRVYLPFKAGELEMDEVEATFEQLPYILSAGIEDVTTGAADGAGTGKIYQYDPPLSAVGSVQTYTIEGGDNAGAEEMEYSFVSEFKLSGKAKEAVMMSATWLGRQVLPSTFTGSVTVPVVEEILFGKGKLYIDPQAGPIGTTLKSDTFLEMALNWKTGWIPAFTADGDLYFRFIKPAIPEIELEITFEHDATSIAEKAAWRALTPRLIRVLFEGSALTTPGTWDFKSLQIDLAGRWAKFDKIDEKDGNDIVKGTFHAGYNVTYANLGQIIVVNQLASLP